LALTLRGILLFTRYTRRNVTLDLPMNQLAIVVTIFGKGTTGATLSEIGEILGGMSQSSVSKNVRALSRFMAPGTDRVVGHDLLRSEPDLVNRKKMRVFLTSRGTELVNVLAACLSGEFTGQDDLPREGYQPGEGMEL
jgi:DNA-binding MarR family transcriptional regulator